jgi:small subunit ribosomal protein S16
VPVKIKLKRLGKIRSPYYRIVVADSRTKRDGRSIEEIGKYHPKENPSLIEVDSDRAQYWLGVGAQPTEPVLAILKKTGDWQRFRGEPAPEPLLRPAPRLDRRARFEAVARESQTPAPESSSSSSGRGRTRKSVEAAPPSESPESGEAAAAPAGDETTEA